VSEIRYRTIVADPPWPHTRRPVDACQTIHSLPYPTMTVEQIAALPVKQLAQNDVAGNRRDKTIPRDGSILYLWTTTSFLKRAFDVCQSWGFQPGPVLVWCKPATGGGAPGGTFRSNVEFVLVGRRGSPRNATRSVRTRWFCWPRAGHSTKPEAFFDLVESVSPGPYLELFARRQRLGWDTWGDEALNHVQVVPVTAGPEEERNGD
jgi:N6-adenosine-specific RNA methylase IME4